MNAQSPPPGTGCTSRSFNQHHRPGDQMFKYMSPWELLLTQTASEGVVEQLLAPELRPWLDGRYGLDMWRLRGRLPLPSMAALL